MKCIETRWDLICLLQIFKGDKPFGTICNSSDQLAEPWQSCGWVKGWIRRHSKPWLAFIWRVHISMRRSIARKLCSSRIKLALIWSFIKTIQNLDFGTQTFVTRLILVCNWNAFLQMQNGLSTWLKYCDVLRRANPASWHFLRHLPSSRSILAAICYAAISVGPATFPAWHLQTHTEHRCF